MTNRGFNRAALGGGLFAGFITLFIIAVFGVVVVSIVGRGCASVTGMDKGKAEKEARDFGEGLGLKVKGSQCVQTDSDGDGYVSCTLAVEGINGSTDIKAIECAATISLNNGCRMQKLGSINGNR